MALAENLGSTINARLSAYDATDGAGADAYCDEPMCHPMAEGKLLEALVALYRCKLLSATQFEQWTTKVCVRLEVCALSYSDDGWCWGLGFSHRGLPSTEPFLITSGIVTRGALECRKEGHSSKILLNLSDMGVRGLTSWLNNLALVVDEAGHRLPAYSPGIRQPIYNAAAYAYGTLKLGGAFGASVSRASGWEPALEWMRSQRVGGVGRTYSQTNPIVDLVHQCYILNSMADAFGVASIEAATTEMVGQFAGPCCFADTMRLLLDGEAAVESRNIPWLRLLHKHRLEVLPKPARLWSLGELLVLLSRLGGDGEHREGWTQLGRRVAESILLRLSTPDDMEATYPRHVMHALHGLTCYLELLREQVKAKAAPLRESK